MAGSYRGKGMVKDDAGCVGRAVLRTQSFVDWILKHFGFHL